MAGAPLALRRVPRHPAKGKKIKGRRRSLEAGRGASRVLLNPNGPEARKARRLPVLRVPRRMVPRRREFHVRRMTHGPLRNPLLACHRRRCRPRHGLHPRTHGRAGKGALAGRRAGTGTRVRAGIPQAGGPPAAPSGGVRIGAAAISRGIPDGRVPRIGGIPTPPGMVPRTGVIPTLPGRVPPVQAKLSLRGRAPQGRVGPVPRASRTTGRRRLVRRLGRPRWPRGRRRGNGRGFWNGLDATFTVNPCP